MDNFHAHPLCNQYTSTAEYWDVEWYSVNRTTLQFEEFLGSEKWITGDLSYDWNHQVVYGGRKDYVGFIATTTMYFDEGEYIFELYNVSDTASIILDGEEILYRRGLDRDAVKINISKGNHTLTLKWKEFCCGASIGFSMGKYVKGHTQNHLPTVTITSPRSGETVSGIIMISGSADDIDGTVKKVQIRIDDGPWLTTTGIIPSNYSGINFWKYLWNSMEVENGQHTIVARAYDGIEYSNICMITVNVDNKKDTPGFEIFSFIGGLLLMLILKKLIF